VIGEGVGDEFLGRAAHGAGKERRNDGVKSEKCDVSRARHLLGR
jgi:hypothetical protein